MQKGYFSGPNPSSMGNSSLEQTAVPRFPGTQQPLSYHWINAMCCPLVPWLLSKAPDRDHTATVAVPGAPPRRVCASRRRRPFCTRRARGIPRPAVASERRQLLPDQETPIRITLLPGPRLREKAPSTPRPARPRPLSHRAAGVKLRSTLLASPRKLL